MSLATEFKAFVMRGNVIDLAVGVVIGAAFGKIVTSLVDQIIMPPIGLLIGGVDFSAYKWVLQAAGPDGKGEVAIQFGAFLNTLSRQGLLQKSLVVFTSDHGEGLGDHRESTHGYFVYQTTLHVPLIVRWPEGVPPLPPRIDEPVSLLEKVSKMAVFPNLGVDRRVF